MSFKRFFSFLLITLLIGFSHHSSAQNRQSIGHYTSLEQIIYQKKQSDILSYISDDCARGRSTGTMHSQLIANYIKKNFIYYGLEPYPEYYYDQFECDSIRGRNVVGVVKSVIPSDEYVIVSAHYDHIGALNGYVYNGADDNASGVTALMNLAEIFGTMRKAKIGPHKNIIFVAFDAKELSMSGSRHFVNILTIPPKNIICDINLDQLGTTLEPVHKGKEDYLIILGENTLPSKHRGKLNICNSFYNLHLDIDYSFYGSKNFTEVIYNLSDQVAFKEKGIPALLFTSGFNKHTYKITDREEIISYPVLKKRTLLVFYFINML
jgi:hypothetical protein